MIEKEKVKVMQKLPRREEANRKYCWKMEDLYTEDALWQRDYETLNDAIGEIENYQGHLSDSAVTLLSFLRKKDELSILAEKVYVYANQKSHEDMGNGFYQDITGKSQNLMVRIESAMAFLQPELLSIPEQMMDTFMEEEQELRKYRRYFDILYRKKEHILSKEMEGLLADAGEMAEGAGDIFTMFNNADLKFPAITDENGNRVELTHGRFIFYMENQERTVRKEAFEILYHTYERYRNTLASTFRANIKQHVFFARAKKYESSLAYSLDNSNIPLGVYDKLIEAVHHNLGLLHQYMSIRKEYLKVDELHMYDLYVPIIGDVQRKITYEEAKEIVKKGLAPLGEEYLAKLQEGFDGGWIDVYENEGKRSGAYSWGAYGTHPFVLLNFQENLNNVFTLAHEMGHALHSYYSDQTQDYIYAGYKIFVAEVASTCNESLLIHYLIENSEREEDKKYLINYFLEQFRGTLFRQTMFAEFEKIVHAKTEEGETLTADYLCELYYQLNQEYFGEDIVVDREIALEWARIPHFYTPFYVYQYATGFSAAMAISRKILQGDEAVLAGYKKFLCGGSSLDPIDLLKLCGVDMTTPEPVEEAMQLFRELLEKM